MRQCEIKDKHTGIEYDWSRRSNAKKPKRQPERNLKRENGMERFGTRLGLRTRKHPRGELLVRTRNQNRNLGFGITLLRASEDRFSRGKSQMANPGNSGKCNTKNCRCPTQKIVAMRTLLFTIPPILSKVWRKYDSFASERVHAA